MELQVTKRKTEQRGGIVETSSEDETSSDEDNSQTPEDTDQSEGNREGEEAGDAEANDQNGSGNEDSTQGDSRRVRSGEEEETSQGSPLLYAERDTSQAVASTTRETEQLDDITRATTQSEDTTRANKQLGNMTRSTVQSGEVRRGRPKKVGGGKELRIKKVKDLGLRIGMVVKIAAKDGSIVEGTVLRRTTKKTGKFPNNFDVRDNASNKVMKDVNFDRVHWYIEDNV